MYSILGPNGPVTLVVDGDQYVTQVAGQNLTAGGSPVVVTANPPLDPIDRVSLGDLYQQAVALLA